MSNLPHSGLCRAGLCRAGLSGAAFLCIGALLLLVGCSATSEPALPVTELTVEKPVASKARPFRVKPMFEDVATANTNRTANAAPRAAVFRDRPNIRITHMGSEPTTSAPTSRHTRGDSLRKLLDEVLEKLEPYENQADADLALADRLRKYKLQKKLIGLHQWLPQDLEALYLDRLLRSLEKPTDPPSKSHALLVASFYHDIDREDLRDAMLAKIRVVTPARLEAHGNSPFRLENMQVCSNVRDFKDYTPVSSGSLKGGKTRTLYGELVGLTNRHDPESDGYESSIEATLHFYRGTVEARRIRLSAAGGDVHTAAVANENNFIAYPFTVPSGLEGQYRMVVRIRDVYAGTEVEAEQSLRMRK